MTSGVWMWYENSCFKNIKKKKKKRKNFKGDPKIKFRQKREHWEKEEGRSKKEMKKFSLTMPIWSVMCCQLWTEPSDSKLPRSALLASIIRSAIALHSPYHCGFRVDDSKTVDTILAPVVEGEREREERREKREKREERGLGKRGGRGERGRDEGKRERERVGEKRRERKKRKRKRKRKRKEEEGRRKNRRRKGSGQRNDDKELFF